MSPLRWSRQALTALDQVGDYLAERDPDAALKVVDAIELAADRLRDFPLSGAPTAVHGVRKLSIPRYRYLLFYSFDGQEVQVLNVRHAAENWR